MGYVVAHGGTTSKPRQRSGTLAAARAGRKVLGLGALEAVVEAVRVLEDDERFHAGVGGTYRLDGQTVELDAGVVCSDTRFGAVGAVEGVRNPVLVARALADLPCNFLVGPGAAAFARAIGMPAATTGTRKALREWRHLVRKVAAGKAGPDDNEWDERLLRAHWNYDVPFEQVFPEGVRTPHERVPLDAARPGRPSRAGSRPSPRGDGGAGVPRPGGARRKARPMSGDTVGAIAFDGTRFAACASTSGMTVTLRGRVGDAAVVGAGILANEHGAVACSGNGDHILRQRLATRVLDGVARGRGAHDAAHAVLAEVPDALDLAIIVGTRDGHAVASNRKLAWSAVTQA